MGAPLLCRADCAVWRGGAGCRRRRFVADRPRGAGAAGEVKVAKLWDPV